MAEIVIQEYRHALQEVTRSFIHGCEQDIVITQEQPVLEVSNTAVCPVVGRQIKLSMIGKCLETKKTCEFHD